MVKWWVFLSLAAVSLFAQTPPDTVPTATTAPPAAELPEAPKRPEQPAEKPIDQQRVLGVLPNYRTANPYTTYTALTGKQKMAIAAKDSFDFPLYFLGGMLAVIDHADGSDPSYGNGAQGFAKRYAANYGDQAIGNLMTEGVMPVLLHEDPRYFRKVDGSFKSRLFYAATRVLVTHTDRGTTRFNYSEWTGNAVAVAVSQTYEFDDRTAGEASRKLAMQCGVDAISNVLKEFWPDVKRHFSKKRE